MNPFFLFTALFLSVFASDSKAETAQLSDVLQARAALVIEKLVSTTFPELRGIELDFKPIKNSAVFLATDIDVASVISGPRKYTLYLNQSLELNPISDLAFEGIMAHELIHFCDYEKMNAFELATFYAQYLMSDAFVASYERKTDLQSFERGYAIGIKAFRNWLYQQISDDDKASKKINYYTPEQIDEWLLSQSDITLL